MDRLVIIDGHAIAHRAYHSIPPLTHRGQAVNAIYGFYSMLLTAVDQLKPKYLVVCVDSPGPTFRSQEFIGYRAKRKPADHDLITQLPLLPQTLGLVGIPVFSMGGYEADDLIATITRLAHKKIASRSRRRLISKVTIITGDKDLMQLVDSKTELYVPVRGLSETKTYDPPEVFNKLGVNPDQVVDLKALMGDMSDNYSGVAGIGPKTAADLLQQYQTLDKIYSNLAKISPSVRSKLESAKEDAYLSQKLADLIDNIPLKFSLKDAAWNDRVVSGLENIFTEYNFKSLIGRLHRLFPQKITKKTVKNSNQTSLF